MAYILLVVLPLLYMALHMQIGQVVLMIENLQVVILCSLVKCQFRGNQESNVQLLAFLLKLSVKS